MINREVIVKDNARMHERVSLRYSSLLILLVTFFSFSASSGAVERLPLKATTTELVHVRSCDFSKTVPYKKDNYKRGYKGTLSRLFYSCIFNVSVSAYTDLLKTRFSRQLFTFSRLRAWGYLMSKIIFYHGQYYLSSDEDVSHFTFG